MTYLDYFLDVFDFSISEETFSDISFLLFI